MAFQKVMGFNFGEAKGIIAATIALSLALTANQWGGETFSAAEGIKNLFIAIPVVALSFIAHEKAHKFGAQLYGTYAKFKPSWLMVALSAAIGIISAGSVIITAVGTSVPASLKRTGFKYPFIGAPMQAKIALFGPMVSLLLAILAKVLMGFFGEGRLLQDLFTFNLWMTFFNMIPLVVPFQKGVGVEKTIFPPFDGAFVLGGSPLFYFGFVAFAVVVVATLVFLPLLAALVISGIAAAVAWILVHEFIVNIKIGG